MCPAALRVVNLSLPSSFYELLVQLMYLQHFLHTPQSLPFRQADNLIHLRIVSIPLLSAHIFLLSQALLVTDEHP